MVVHIIRGYISQALNQVTRNHDPTMSWRATKVQVFTYNLNVYLCQTHIPIHERSATMSEFPKILLTGATGFIGGTILTQLLNSSSTQLQNARITCLLRGDDRAAKLSEAYGDRVNPIIYQSLDDLGTTVDVAAQHDIVINTTNGYHAASAQALVQGLARRKETTRRTVWMIHTSGTSNLSDRPITGTPVDCEFNDEDGDVYDYEKRLEAEEPYAQRTAELGVVDKGLELGVNTLVIMSPTIYGTGSGLFNTTSIQIPACVRAVLAHGRGVVVGDGKGVWDHVHVLDLVELYELAVVEILRDGGSKLPRGKKGIIFSGNGRHTWLGVMQEVVSLLHQEGKIEDDKMDILSLSEATKLLAPILPGADERLVEFALCSNSRTEAKVAKSLGWQPTRGKDAWRRGFREDVEGVLQTL